MAKRTEDEYFAGYALSRLSESGGAPPIALGVDSWNDAYDLFYERMNSGRSESSFRNSLKNVRDAFDAHIPGSPRIGWQDGAQSGRPPGRGTQISKTLVAWSSTIDDQVRDHMLALIRGADPVNISGRARTEGGLRVRMVRQYERDPTLRAEAIAVHGSDCAGCGFSFAVAYGDWGAGYIEIHHVQPLGDGDTRQTNPMTDLIPLCANCHLMVHRKPGICLTLSELKNILSRGERNSCA